jgi:hypothetical protein
MRHSCSQRRTDLNSDDRARYRAWLLRCWEVPHAGGKRPADWRFSLEEPHTGERRGFANSGSLLDYANGELTESKTAHETLIRKRDPRAFKKGSSTCGYGRLAAGDYGGRRPACW